MTPLGPDKRFASVLVPTGALGAGVDAALVQRGIDLGADAIACDAGSTDSGPSYLARGVSKVSREAVKHDLTILVAAAQAADIPLLIGTCGTCGTDSGVDWTNEIVLEIASEQGLTPKIALLYSEQTADTLISKLHAGATRPLSLAPDLDEAALNRCDHIVALMGVEPYINALSGGAEIILGGRTTDTAVLAAVPLLLGAGAGPSWHAAKTAECGSLCTTNPRGGGVLIRVSADDFEIEPLGLTNRCTPYTVSAHMLYENSDPFELIEPGGVLNVRDAVYDEIDARSVRVRQSRWDERPYTMKLEGASSGPFQTMMLIGIRDPKVLARLDEFHDRMLTALRGRLDATLGERIRPYDISLRIYGWNALGPVPERENPPHEVCMMFLATAATQELATLIAKTCNPGFFHFPIDPEMELPSYAFPFTPAEVERGRVYSFELNHVVEVADGLELVRTRWIDLAAPVTKEAHHA